HTDSPASGAAHLTPAAIPAIKVLTSQYRFERRPAMRPIRWLFLLLPSLLFALGCAKESATPGAQGSPKAPTVSVSTPVTRAVTEYEEFTGMTQAMQTIEVRARVSGYLSKIYFKNKEGAVVKEGDPLFEIDQRPYKAALAQAQANLAQAKAHAER